jgi:glycosyltransferase involved in cell wall biosynthesis
MLMPIEPTFRCDPQELDPSRQPLVSVVTPVYNGEDFLQECIESVQAQSYQNWDYVIVNNRSTDRTLEIAQRYAARDPRIRVYDNSDFLPIVQNHNHAIRQISPRSKYCKVVLGDDWLFPECLMKMVALAEANPSVGIVGAYGFDGVHVLWDAPPYPETVVSGREMCRRRLLTGKYVFGPPSAVLLRSEFVHSRKDFYDEWNLHADSTVYLRLLQDSDFGFVHQLLTFVRRREASNTSFAKSMNSFHLAWLTELVEYGPLCLNERQYQDRLEVQLKAYYDVLAGSALQFRGGAYWDFHKNRLRTIGIPLDRTRLFKAVCWAILNQLLHPLRAAKSVAHWWPKAFARTQSTARKLEKDIQA